ncbi:MAG TPA: hypothetical protein VN316_02750 [candidate division Zixibacteria bacterium]|nr:hypothetical protein [candidate division Zixibacteria bacterium]
MRSENKSYGDILKIGRYEWQERVNGGNNQELIESLRYGTKAIIRVEGESISEATFTPLPFPPGLIMP